MTERLHFENHKRAKTYGTFVSLFSIGDESECAKLMAKAGGENGEGTTIVHLDAAACRGLAADLLLAAERLEHNNNQPTNGTDDNTTDDNTTDRTA